MVDSPATRKRKQRTEDSDFLLRASSMHLERVKVLSEREWKTMVLYWGTLLTSGAGLISASSNIDVAVTSQIAHCDWIIILSYYVSASVYLIGYSGNIHQSLVTERNRYQYLQDQAMQLRVRTH